MKMRLYQISIVLLIILLILYRYFPVNKFLDKSKIYYEISKIPESVKQGEKITVRARITNKSMRSYKISTTGNMILIKIYKETEREPVQRFVEMFDVFFSNITKETSETFIFQEKGLYIIEIKALFYIKSKEYNIEILKKFITVE